MQSINRNIVECKEGKSAPAQEPEVCVLIET